MDVNRRLHKAGIPPLGDKRGLGAPCVWRARVSCGIKLSGDMGTRGSSLRRRRYFSQCDSPAGSTGQCQWVSPEEPLFFDIGETPLISSPSQIATAISEAQSTAGDQGSAPSGRQRQVPRPECDKYNAPSRTLRKDRSRRQLGSRTLPPSPNHSAICPPHSQCDPEASWKNKEPEAPRLRDRGWRQSCPDPAAGDRGRAPRDPRDGHGTC